MAELKIVPDTSVIIEGLLSKEISAGNIKPSTVIIHEAVISELEAQANKRRDTGFMGLEELKALRELSKKKKFNIEYKGERPKEFEIRYAKSGEIDSLIRDLALKEKATLYTADIVQKLTAETKGVKVMFHEFEDYTKKPIALEKFFDSTTMSIHLKEGTTPKAKKGSPGKWEFKEIRKKKSTQEEMQEISQSLVEDAKQRKDSFLEIQRKGSIIMQISTYRIVVTKPPFADGYEITAVRPVKHLSLADYKLTDKMKQRLSEQAEGILISGAPGHGKSTFAQALAEYYASLNKVIKTVEAPRDLVLPDEVTQYAMSHGSSQEIHDVLLLSRPDYTIFDEMRNTADFSLFSDLRLSGVGMVGVVHATQTIDAIQRFIGRIELGVIPHVVDTVIFIRGGEINKVYSLSMEVKVPSGMYEQDLARPVVVINDFENGKPEFEIYTYGEQTVVMPISEGEGKAPTHKLAEKTIMDEFSKYGDVEVDVVSPNKAVVYVDENRKASIIGKQGSNIDKIESRLGISIDVRSHSEKEGSPHSGKSKEFDYSVKKKNINIDLGPEFKNEDVDIFVSGDYLMTARTSSKGKIRITKSNKIGRVLLKALQAGEDVEVRI